MRPKRSTPSTPPKTANTANTPAPSKGSSRPATVQRPRGAAMRERILSVAERLFAEHGIDGVSLRDIAKEAGVRVSLLSYYYPSKESLYRSVFVRRFEAYSTERLASLRALTAGPRAPSAEELLTVFARPWIQLRSRRGGLIFTRLVSREYADPNESKHGILKEFFDPIAAEYLTALEKSLPAFSKKEIHYAFYCFSGGMFWLLVNPGRVERLSGRSCRLRTTADLEAAVNILIGIFTRSFVPRRVSRA